MKDFERVLVTGDTHGSFLQLKDSLARTEVTGKDLIIILGDVGVNFHNDFRDDMAKENLAVIPAQFLLIRGNHEMRPTDPGLGGKYQEEEWFGGTTYAEEAYPRFHFAKDGERFHINGRDFLVIGGAYSVDKFYRLRYGLGWFPDEQLSEEEMSGILEAVKEHGGKEDIILSHTCPYEDRPTDMFLPRIDQSKVDSRMEQFLQEVKDSVSYNEWYCGHWHINRKTDDIHFLFEGIEEISAQGAFMLHREFGLTMK